MNNDRGTVRDGERRGLVREFKLMRRNKGLENDHFFGKSKRNRHSKVLLLL